jgi:zinc transporter 9
MAIVLINKNRKLLIGKAIPKEIREDIIELMEQDGIIEKVLDFKSTMLDMDTYHIKCEIECNGTGLLKEINRNNFLKNEYEEVKESYGDFLEFCIDYTRRVPRIIGTKIDELEQKIKDKFPQVRHIDIEIN